MRLSALTVKPSYVVFNSWYVFSSLPLATRPIKPSFARSHVSSGSWIILAIERWISADVLCIWEADQSVASMQTKTHLESSLALLVISAIFVSSSYSVSIAETDPVGPAMVRLFES